MVLKIFEFEFSIVFPYCNFSGTFLATCVFSYPFHRPCPGLGAGHVLLGFLPPPLHQALWSGGQRPEVLSGISATSTGNCFGFDLLV